MSSDELRDAIERLQQDIREVFRAVSDVRLNQANAAADFKIGTQELRVAAERLSEVAEKVHAAQSPPWYASPVAMICASALGLLIVGRELAPALISILGHKSSP